MTVARRTTIASEIESMLHTVTVGVARGYFIVRVVEALRLPAMVSKADETDERLTTDDGLCPSSGTSRRAAQIAK